MFLKYFKRYTYDLDPERIDMNVLCTVFIQMESPTLALIENSKSYIVKIGIKVRTFY